MDLKNKLLTNKGEYNNLETKLRLYEEHFKTLGLNVNDDDIKNTLVKMKKDCDDYSKIKSESTKTFEAEKVQDISKFRIVAHDVAEFYDSNKCLVKTFFNAVSSLNGRNNIEIPHKSGFKKVSLIQKTQYSCVLALLIWKQRIEK